jgi:23S rRNA pseudouridine1911/1915/1917 synthase
VRPVVHFEDEDIVIVEKPFGLPTQRDKKGTDGLFELLQNNYEYVGLHHRLDRPASGLVLFTLSKRANREIGQAMSEHRITRGYQAVLVGTPRVQVWTQDVGLKSAHTDLSIVSSAEGMSLVNVQLQTGRKHQIRRHAALNATPIAGDRRYGAEAGGWWKRLALHANTMALKHPITGDIISVQSPIPQDLLGLWAMFSK